MAHDKQQRESDQLVDTLNYAVKHNFATRLALKLFDGGRISKYTFLAVAGVFILRMSLWAAGK